MPVLNRLLIKNRWNLNAIKCYETNRKMSASAPFITNKINKSVMMTFDRPKSLNAVNGDMAKIVYSSLKGFEEKNDAIDMVFLRGAGKAFSSGGDLQFFLDGMKIPDKLQGLHDCVDHVYQSLYRLSMLKTPTISLLNGLTVGLGAGFSYCTDIKIATENTLLMMPETTIGHFCDVSSSYYLSRLEGHFGIYLALCAEKIRVDELLHTGLASYYVPSHRLDGLIHHLTSMASPNLNEINNEIIQFTDQMPHRSNAPSTTPGISQDEKEAVINHCFRFDAAEEIVNALEAEGSKFSLACKDKILASSPKGIKLTLELLRRASALTLAECLILERQLWTIDIGTHDFIEGCMSKLEKRSPEWYPRQLQEVCLQNDIQTPYFDRAATSIAPLDLYA